VPSTALLLNVTNASGFLADSSGNQTVTNNSVSFKQAAIAVPSPPTSLTSVAGNGQAEIGFIAGADGGSPIANYKYSIDGSTYIPLSPARSTTPITIIGLTNGTTYNVQLKAVNAVGESTASSAVSVTPLAPAAPAAPTTGATGEAIASSPVASDSANSGSVETTTVKTKSLSGKKFVTWNTNSELILKTYNKTTKKSTVRKLKDGKAFIKNPQPGQTAKYTISSSSGSVLKAFTVRTKPGLPKRITVQRQATTLNATWSKAAGATRYRVIITPQIGQPIVLITTDSNISIDLKNSAKATIKIVAIGANGLTSEVLAKTA
jgi:hypothetical protein